jgi:hypothetical protein
MTQGVKMNTLQNVKAQELTNTVKDLTVQLNNFLIDNDFYSAQTTLQDIQLCVKSIKVYTEAANAI